MKLIERWCLLVALAGAACGRADARPGEARATSDASAIAPGGEPPDVTCTLEDGFDLHLSLLRGKVVLLIFCADGNAPKCALEARGLSDRWAALQPLEVALVGVYAEDAAANRALAARQGLTFDLAADDGRLARAFGAGAFRAVLIGRDHRIRAVWDDPDPAAHAAAFAAAAR